MQEMQTSGTMLAHLEACAQEYQAKLRAERRVEGREEGRVEVLQEQRSGLCRLAQRRFGATAATDFARRIEGIDDFARLWEIGNLISDCGGAGEFAARLREIE